MAKLKLSFYENTFLHDPTEEEIFELEGLVLSASAIIEALDGYALCTNDDAKEISGNCSAICRVLNLLLDPITEYFSTWAGDEAAQEHEPENEGEKR